MICYLSFTFEHAQIQQDLGFDWSFGKKLGCSNTTSGFSAICSVMISSPGNVWPRTNLTILTYSSYVMSLRLVAMLPSFHPNQGLWCQVNVRLSSRLRGWLHLAIIFNISKGYTNSPNKISTTYTAQKQILLSPKNTKMLLGRGRLLIFIRCILLVFKFFIITKQRTYLMWMGQPLSLLAAETSCYHPCMERVIWPSLEVLGLGAWEWGQGSGILVCTGLSEPGWVRPVLSAQCWCWSLVSPVSHRSGHWTSLSCWGTW